MKRLLGLLGITCMCVLTACFYLGDVTALVIGALGVLVLYATLFVRKFRLDGTFTVASVVAIISVILYLFNMYCLVYPVQDKYDSRTVTVKAVQQGLMYQSNNRYCYKLKVKSVDGEKVKSNIILYSDDAIISSPCDEFEFATELYAVSSGDYLSQRVYLRAFVQQSSDVSVLSPENKPPMYYVYTLKDNIRKALYLEMDSDTAAFSSALLLSDKYSMDNSVKDLLRTCGISHIAVVSGLHLSIITAFCLKSMMLLTKRNKYISSCVTIVVALLFALITGFGRSVSRAVVLMIIFLIGRMIKRQSDSVNSIGAAALLLCLINPLSVGDVGMLLSFASTLGIVVWGQRMVDSTINRLSLISVFNQKVVNFFLRIIVNGVCITVSALLWTLPISVLCFGEVSLVAVLANILTVPMLMFVIIFAALCVVFHYIGFMSFVCDLLSYLVALYYDYLIYVCTTLSKFRFSYVSADKPFFYVFMGLTLLLIAVAVVVNKKLYSLITFALSVVIFCTSYCVHFIKHNETLTLHIPDTGTGLTVVMETSSGHAVLCASGTSTLTYNVTDIISTFSYTENDIYISTPGDNNKKYATDITNEFDYKDILRYDKEVSNTSATVTNNICVTDFSSDYVVELWDKAQLKLIADDNKVFEYITAGDTEVLILPAQADCEHLPEDYRTPDVIITRDVFENPQLISCDTLIVAGSDYKTDATAEICSKVAKEVIFGGKVAYDIKL